MSEGLWEEKNEALLLDFLENKDVVNLNPEDLLNNLKFAHEKEIANKIIDTWSGIQKKDARLRKKYGKYLIWILIGQLAIMDLALIAKGFKWIDIPSKELPYWLGALVIEVIGLIAVTAKGLFKNTTKDFHNLVSTLTAKPKK